MTRRSSRGVGNEQRSGSAVFPGNGHVSAAAAPRLGVEPGDVRPGGRSGEWRIDWRLSNAADAPVRVESVWEPHGRFRGEERTLEPPLSMPSGGSVELELPVRCDVGAGETIENGFLIFRVLVGEQAWRVLTRLTIVGGADGTPMPRVEAITSQVVGFSHPTGS